MEETYQSYSNSPIIKGLGYGQNLLLTSFPHVHPYIKLAIADLPPLCPIFKDRIFLGSIILPRIWRINIPNTNKVIFVKNFFKFIISGRTTLIITQPIMGTR